jgi:dihydropyrimidinase
MNVSYDLWDGKTVAGSVRSTLCRGTTVFDQGEIKTQPGHGKFLKRIPFDVARQGDLA